MSSLMKKKPTILVVDDDPNLRKTVTDILRINGYETVTAETGHAAIAALQAALPDLALVDLILPDMSGLKVLERIKGASPLTEVIILTDADLPFNPQTPEMVATRPGWDGITAVQNGAIYAVPGALYSTPGPRLIQGLESLAKLLHPDRFPSGQTPSPSGRGRG